MQSLLGDLGVEGYDCVNDALLIIRTHVTRLENENESLKAERDNVLALVPLGETL